MNAEMLARALGGRRSGGTWLARCPAHDDRKPSLAIRDGDGRVLVRCHAGCDQRDVIAVLRHRGLWSPADSARAFRPAPCPVPSGLDIPKRIEAAMRIWDASQDARGTLAAVYLASRGLVLPLSGGLRFHPALQQTTGVRWPAMVALVVDVDGKPVGVHRTFLARDGVGKAPVSPARMSLGPIRGGAVRLAPAAKKLAIGEGIETVLSVMQSTDIHGWAALSTSGLKTLVLPEFVEEVVILADADPPGEVAAQAAAARWMCEGRRVRIARPSGGFKDFNDMLRVENDGRAAA